MRELLPSLLWVAVGSSGGGAARFLISGVVARAIGETFPWGTLVVNVSGALAIGVLAASSGHAGLMSRPEAWPLAATGFLGSYTTVSSFSLQTLTLARDGEWLKAIGNILLSLLLCLSAVTLGIVAASAAFAGGTA